jgi:uncharacterized protein (TIGR03437 family)
MKTSALICLALGLLPLWSAETSLHYLNWGAKPQTCCMVADGSGNVYITGKMVEADPLHPGSFLSYVAVSKLDLNDHVVYTFRIPGDGEPAGLAVDKQGNLFVVGASTASAFPTVNPLAGPARAYSEIGSGFISKINAAGTQLLFSAVFGSTAFNAVAVDANDNVVVAGTTSASDYPITANAYQRTAPAFDGFGRSSFAFVTRMNNAGSQILHSTFLGNGHSPCSGGSVCIGKLGVSSASSIAIGNDGSVTIGGFTTTDQFPVTSGAFQTTCKCTSGQPRVPLPTGFIARFSMDLSALRWSTYFGGSSFQYSGDSVGAVALRSDGGVVVSGVAGSRDFPVTAGAFQTEYRALESQEKLDGFVARLGPSGNTLIFASYVGSSAPGLWLDSEEHAWITGKTASPSSFPVLSDSLRLGNSYVVELTSDGVRPITIELLPNGSAGTSLARDLLGRVILLGSTGSVLRIPATGPANTVVLGQANAAGSAVSNHVAPGEIVSLYGVALGPAVGAGARVDSNGRIATELESVRVLFDGTPAPLFYAGANQINVVVPFEVAGKSSTSVQTISPGGSSNAFDLAIVPADPQIFFGTNGYAATFNQDGSINSETAPAAPGSVLAFYVNGAGLFDSTFADGMVVAPPLPAPLLPVTATFDGAATEVLYAGAAPGIVAGVMRVNIRVPQTLSGNYHTVGVKVGDTASISVRVAAH